MEFRTARPIRISLAVGGAVVVLLVVAPFVIPANRFRPTIEQAHRRRLAATFHSAACACRCFTSRSRPRR